MSGVLLCLCTAREKSRMKTSQLAHFSGRAALRLAAVANGHLHDYCVDFSNYAS